MDDSKNTYSQNDHSKSCPYYLGVDGGGSKTLAIVVDAQGRERGRGLAGSANYMAVGLVQATQNISSAVEQAVSAADCTMPLSKAWLGLAGVDRPVDAELLAPHCAHFAALVHLTNDADLALSALKDMTGIALIAGTGSIALGRDRHGVVSRAGGWGHILGDEGSGYIIGLQGLQAVARAADGRGPSTILSELILQHWHITSAEDIIGEVYVAGNKAKIAQVSLCVLNAARQLDQVALAIVLQAATELALLVQAVSKRLHFAQEPVPLALGGGLLLHEAFLRDLVISSIGQQLNVGPIVIVEQPALSAARAAMQL